LFTLSKEPPQRTETLTEQVPLLSGDGPMPIHLTLSDDLGPKDHPWPAICDASCSFREPMRAHGRCRILVARGLTRWLNRRQALANHTATIVVARQGYIGCKPRVVSAVTSSSIA